MAAMNNAESGKTDNVGPFVSNETECGWYQWGHPSVMTALAELKAQERENSMATFEEYQMQGIYNRKPNNNSDEVWDALKGAVNAAMDAVVPLEDLTEAQRVLSTARGLETHYEYRLIALHVEQGVKWYKSWRDDGSIGTGIEGGDGLQQRYHEAQAQLIKAAKTVEKLTTKRTAAALQWIAEYPELIANEWLEMQRDRLVYDPKRKPNPIIETNDLDLARGLLNSGDYVLSHVYVDDFTDHPTVKYVLTRRDCALQVLQAE